MELALQRLFMFIPRWEVKPALSWKYSSQNIFPGNPVNIKMQVSLMSHSCVANLEVVDPPSRSIAFRVKRPVSWSLSYFPQCIGIGKNIYCTWNRCILWRSKAWVFESKKWKCGAWKWKVQQQILHGSCHLHVLLLARQRNSIFICNLLLNLPFPFMRIKKHHYQCPGVSWGGADLVLHKCSSTSGGDRCKTSRHLDVQVQLSQVMELSWQYVDVRS